MLFCRLGIFFLFFFNLFLNANNELEKYIIQDYMMGEKGLIKGVDVGKKIKEKTQIASKQLMNEILYNQQNYSEFYKSIDTNSIEAWLQKYVGNHTICKTEEGLCDAYLYSTIDLIEEKIIERKKDFIKFFKEIFYEEGKSGGNLKDSVDFLKLDEIDQATLVKAFVANTIGKNSWSWSLGRLRYFLATRKIVFNLASDINTNIFNNTFSIKFDFDLLVPILQKILGENKFISLTSFDYQNISVSCVIKGIAFYDDLLRLLNLIKDNSLKTYEAFLKKFYEESKKKQLQVTSEDLTKKEEGPKGIKIVSSKRGELQTLMEAVIEVDKIQEWLKKKNLDVNYSDSRFNYTPLNIVLMKYSLEEILKQDKDKNYFILGLITKENIDKPNKFGFSPLYNVINRAINILQEVYLVREKEKYEEGFKETGTVVADTEKKLIEDFNKWIIVIKLLKSKGATLDNKAKALLDLSYVEQKGIKLNIKYFNQLRALFNLSLLKEEKEIDVREFEKI